jgi:hypothetical protein
MDWASLTAHSAPASNAPTSLASVATPSAQGQSAAKLWSPQNPLLAFGIVAALTFGAMAFSTTVRVGHTKSSLSVGST